MQRIARVFVLSVLIAGLGGCSSRLSLPSLPGLPSGVEQDRAPVNPDVDLSKVVNPVPRLEPKSATGNSPYRVYGVHYTPMNESRGFSEKGVASWYGLKFHGRRTSSGEPYDMYQMTAAHRTLPLPSYVLVENLENGRSIIVRVNDRGPFSNDRVIDLSYVAALKLDVVRTGTAKVRVTAIDPATTVTAGTVGTPGVVGAPTVSITDEPNNAQPGNAVVNAAAQSTGQISGQVIGQSAAVAQPARNAGVAPGALVFVQVGAFGDYDNAVRLQTRLSDQGFGPVIVTPASNGAQTLYRVRIGPLASKGEADFESQRLSNSAPALGLGAGLRPRVVVE